MADPKIQILIEAVNKTKAELNTLKQDLESLKTKASDLSNNVKTSFGQASTQATTLKEAISNLKGKMDPLKETLQGVATGTMSAGQGLSSLKDLLGGVVGKLGLVAAAVVGIAAVKGKMDEAVASVQEYGREVYKLSKMTGMSAEASSEFLATAKLLGVSFDTMSPAIAQLAKRMGGVKDAEMAVVDETGAAIDVFDKFKIRITDSEGNLLSFSNVFDQIRDRVRGEENPFQRLAIATQFFKGQLASELMPLLTASKEKLTELTQKVRDYGMVLNNENLLAVRQYTLAERELEMAQKGKQVVLGQVLIPLYTEWIKILTKLISVVSQVTKAVKEFFFGPSDVKGLQAQMEKYKKLEETFLAKGTRGQSAAEHYNRLWNESYEKMKGILQRQSEEEPKMGKPTPSKPTGGKGKDKTDAFDKFQIDLEGELEALNAGFSEYEKAYIQFRTKIVKAKEEYSSVPGANKYLDSMLGKYDQALYNKFYMEAQQKARERQEKELVVEAETQQRLLDVKLDFENKYNQQLLAEGKITNEQAVQNAIDIEVQKLEAAQNTIAVKQDQAKTEAEVNALAGEYLRIQDQIINIQKLGIGQVAEARRKDANVLLDQKIAYEQNALEIAKIVGTLEEEAVLQQKLLELQMQKAIAAAMEKEATAEQLAMIYDMYQIKIAEAGKGALTGGEARSAGIADGFREATKQIGTEYEQWKVLTRTTMQNIRSSISDALVNVMKGDFSNFGQIWDRMLDNMYRAVADKLSGQMVQAFSSMWNDVANNTDGWLQNIIKAISDWVKEVIAQLMAVKAAGSGGGSWWSNLFGGGGGGGGDYSEAALAAEGLYGLHKGGYVPAYHGGGFIMRYHGGGLTHDEVPIIAKKGEYMLSKDDVDFVNRVKSGGPTINVNMGGAASAQRPTIVPFGVTVNMDNASSTYLQASSSIRRAGDAQYIIDVVLKDINSRGRLGRLSR